MIITECLFARVEGCRDSDVFMLGPPTFFSSFNVIHLGPFREEISASQYLHIKWVGDSSVWMTQEQTVLTHWKLHCNFMQRFVLNILFIICSWEDLWSFSTTNKKCLLSQILVCLPCWRLSSVMSRVHNHANVTPYRQ